MPTFLEASNGIANVPTQTQLAGLDGAIFNTVITEGASAVGDGGAALWGTLTGSQSANGTTVIAGANGSFFGKISALGGSGGSGFANPMTTAGDLIKGGSGGTAQRLAIGSNGQVLTVSGGAPAWATPSGGSGGIPAGERSINVDFDYAGNIQNAINAALAISTTNPPAIYLGPHNYNISATLNIGSSTSNNLTGLKIYGDSRLGTSITMTANNLPIFEITGALVHSLEFKDMTIGYSTLQAATNAPMFLCNGASGSSFYNSQWENIRAQNFSTFMSCPNCSWWGMLYQSCWFGDFSYGINNIPWGAGEPRCRFIDLYILAPSATGILFIHNAMTAEYYVECNGLNSGATLLQDLGGGTHMIEHWALEVATYGASGNTILFDCENSVLLARHIYFNTLTINSGTTVYAFHAEENNNVSYYTCDYLFGVNWTNNGSFYVSDSPGGHKCHLGQVNLPWAANCALTVASFQADHVIVDDWNDESYVNALADANTTLTFSSARIQLIPAITAARTYTIPDQTSVPQNLFLGRRFLFLKSSKAAFATTIKSANGTTLATIPASMAGEIDLLWQPDSNTWTTVTNITFS